MLHNINKRVLAALAGAAAVLAGAFATAGATKYSVSEQDFILRPGSKWYVESGGFGRVECRVTLRGRWVSRTISSTIGSTSATITESAIDTCGAGTTMSVIGASLPWQMVLQSTTGALPRIEDFTFALQRADLLIRFDTEMICLAPTEAMRYPRFVLDRDTSTNVLEDIQFINNPTITIRDLPGSIWCDTAQTVWYNILLGIYDDAGNRPRLTLI
jgi:hypothetical protein